MSLPYNARVAMRLMEMADVLEQQGANPFRVRAYRRAADTVEHLERGVDTLLAAGGVKGLEALPGVGAGIAQSISEIVTTGRWAQLDRLRGTLEGTRLFQTVPGIGPELAERIHDELHIDTLEALENAAWDGRLQQVPGIGTRRLTALRATLATLLGRTRRQTHVPPVLAPGVDLLLAIDRQYRDQAATGHLPQIAPRRFNPEAKAWLPILHTEQDGWNFTTMYSNTARAHELGRTDDWVVVYFYDDHHVEGQHTVVTETHGPLEGQRVVRGREAECLRHYGIGTG
ncbi:MAG: helix-hairpin-helix domain-containing protein [Gammaproteobacteria bacterium]|nr:helix-hairpin-helix domain-containing protein [Gammaproteobacteria bacterium]